MNTAGLRRRGYKKKEEGIVLPAGYTLGEYWDVTRQTFVELGDSFTGCDFEVGIEPSELNNNNGYTILGNPSGHFWKILKGGYPCGWNNTGTETVYFTVGEYALISGHIPTEYSDGNSYRYCVNSTDTGLRPGNRAVPILNFMAGTKYAYDFKGKIYPLKIWRDGELIKHYVPCVDSQNNGYMYEVVEGEFITPSVGTLVVK